MASARSGRPSGFDRDVALRRAVVVFWERGYESTSLPQLLAAMGIARSSFYAAFGSKHRVMLEALDVYTNELYAKMQSAAAGGGAPGHAVAAVLDIAACSPRPAHGCLFVNMVTELGPRDAAVRTRARRYLARVDMLFRALLRTLGHDAATATVKSAALLALAAGAVSLRKAGEPEKRVNALLEQARLLAD